MLVDMCYQKSPYPIVWFVSSNGYLLGMTYVPEQQVVAWHWHDTAGTFESVTTVAEGNDDPIYVVVNRTLNGNTVRCIERQASRLFASRADSYLVDCGLTYDGVAATVISGLDHLEGETVSILADGAVCTDQVVNSGTITLDVAASKVHVGLAYISDIETLPAAFEGPAYGQGAVKNVNRVWLRVVDSAGVFVGPSTDDLTEYKQRTTEVYGEPPGLITGEIDIDITPTWQDGGQVFVRQTAPLPLTITALVCEVEVGN